MYSERRFSVENILSYLTNGYFLGQIGGEIGQKLGQISQSANLV